MAGSSIKESDLKIRIKTIDKPEQQQAGQGKGSPKIFFYSLTNTLFILNRCNQFIFLFFGNIWSFRSYQKMCVVDS